MNQTLALVIRDCFGRPLQEGDEVFIGLRGPVLFRIVNIRPNLNPAQSPNLVTVDFAATVSFNCKREAVNIEFIRTRTYQEAGPHPFTALPPKAGQA